MDTASLQFVLFGLAVALVVDHYAKLGFTKIQEESGLTHWELLVKGTEPESAPMKVVSRGFSAATEIPIT